MFELLPPLSETVERSSNGKLVGAVFGGCVGCYVGKSIYGKILKQSENNMEDDVEWKNIALGAIAFSGIAFGGMLVGAIAGKLVFA